MTGNFVDDFPHGFFFIRSKAKKMAIDVYDGGMLNEYNIIIWPQKMVDSINQLWMHEDGFLINKKSGLVLDIRGGDIKKDKVIIQYARKPGLAHNQRWKYQDGYIVSAAAPHLVLDIRGGDFKEGNQVFLNTKDSTSSTQQWLLEPFQDARSEQDLALLRPPPLEKHQSCTFPRPEELYSCYRSVFLENKPDATPEQVAAAAGFQAMRNYIHDKKVTEAMDEDPYNREELLHRVDQEVTQLLSQRYSAQDVAHLKQETKQAVQAYFVREYESQ